MFGGSKPTFGQSTAGAGFGFTNTPTAAPFGQSTFGKPATAAFGQAPSFGTPNTLFGTQQNTGSLFGAPSTSTAFGAATTTQPAFGSFAQQGGQQQTSSLFVQAQQPNANQASLFAQSGSSAFGAAKPSGFGFGQAAQPNTSLFGQSAATSTAPSFGSFGQTATNSGMFGATTTGFGQTGATAGTATGTAVVKYQPTKGTDTLIKNGQPNSISTNQHCITAMEAYGSKSLEELRFEDYAANRKGPQAGSSAFGFGQQQQQPAAGGLFNTPAQQTTTLFGQQPQQTDNKGIFGQNTGFGQTTGTSFGGPSSQAANSFLAKPFSTPATSTAGFGFGATDTSTNNVFGAKPFGQTGTTSLFGQQTAQTAAPAFGQQSTGFSVFGSNQQSSVFGNTANDPNKTNFNLAAPTSNTNFGGFGAQTNTNTAANNFFGKPNTGFGAQTGFAATSTATGFTGFGNTNTSGSLFNNTLNKPATTGFAFGAQPLTAPVGGGLNFNSGATSLFGNNANKTAGFMGGTTQTSGGLFGGGTLGGFGTNTSLGGFGSNTLGGNTTLGNAQQQSGVPIHQQILAKVTSPYGDNPIFKNLKSSRDDDPQASKATNPVAQLAILEANANQFKVSTRPTNAIKIKPKKSLFDGLEEYDSTVEEVFTIKPNAKRLILKPKAVGSSTPKSSTPNSSFNQNKDSPLAQNERQKLLNTSANTNTNISNENFNSEVPRTFSNSANNKEVDTSRRESWLNPNALDKVRQQNIQSDSLANNTLSELMPRKNIDVGRLSKGSTSLEESTEPRKDYQSDEFEDSLFAGGSFDVESDELTYPGTHPTGITLKRQGYYIIPSLDELKSYLAEDGTCIVPNFTVGRNGYGNVFFDKEIDVANLNIDEIVHFRHKEVILYPDDDNKPPVGSELNRDAQITLDQVWPQDKTKHESIKDPERLYEMDYEGKLRRVCEKHDMRFIEYRPETGSWVFRVKHFSKYGLNDSDEEDDIPTDPKKLRISNKEIDKLKKQSLTKENFKKADDKQTDLIGVANKENSNIADKSNLSPIDENISELNFFENSSRHIGHTSPTAALAKGSGTDSHKLQLMKASFFIDDDMDGKSVVSEQYDGRDSPDQMVPNKFLSNQELYSSSHSLWKDGYGFSGASSHMELTANSPINTQLSTIEESQSGKEKNQQPEAPIVKHIPLIIKPKIAAVKLLDTNIPFQNSIAYAMKAKCISDLGIFNCRKFKVGFGPQNNLIFPSSRKVMLNNVKDTNINEIAGVFEGRSFADTSPTVLQNIKISSAMFNQSFEKSIVEHLEIQLRYSLQVEVEDSDCPYIKSGSGTELIVKHLEEAQKIANLGELEDYAVSVWSLCLSLWGEMEELEGQEVSNHFSVMCRRNLLSEWLETTLTEKDILTKAVSKNDYLEHLMNLLLCHKVTNACELAFQNDDGYLSLLMSQLSSGPTTRQLMEDQLAAWNRDEVDKFINIDRLKLLMLVAGVSLMNSYHGPINILDGIDWLQVLALQLWYLCSPTCSATDAIIAYEKSFKSEQYFAHAPTPSYEALYVGKSKQNLYDLRYHILQLYSKRSHPMERLLNPATHTPDPMDYRLSWLLLQTFEALGYHHCSELFESQIHVCFASQLENQNLWQWAIFVLLHIKDRNRRELCIQNVLYRYVTVSQDNVISDKEKFVVNSLGIPQKWIDWAKAVKAGSMANYHLQAKYLIKAKQWSLAHDVIFKFIAPDAIINDNLNYLHSLLIQFDSSSLNKNVKVPNWSNQGQIFLDFIEINDKIESLKTLHEGDIEARWENLKPQLAELCSRINLLPCPTPKHRLCQSEIAKNLACLVRGIQLVCPVDNPCLMIKIALEKLPLPQEFAQQELRALLDTLVADMCKTDYASGDGK